MTTSSSADEALRWLRFAHVDLQFAEEAAASGEFAPRLGCFHAQQCVEKALKSILVYLRLSCPSGEDLDEIRDLIPPGWFVSIAFPDLSALTRWGTVAQYPGDRPDATDQDARDASQQAREIWETVLKDYSRRGLDVSVYR